MCRDGWSPAATCAWAARPSDTFPIPAPAPRKAGRIERVFSPTRIPGFDAGGHFNRYRAYVELTRGGDPATPRARSTADPLRGTYRGAVEWTYDRNSGPYRFRRYEVELRQEFAGFRRAERLTLHGLVSVGAGGPMPYYLQYTLGGTGLHAFRRDTMPSDGADATLRGYRSYRFRDRNLALAQAEYRLPLSRWAQATIFYDLGQVASRAGDLGRSLRHDAGFSLAYVHNRVPVGRLDVGFGGDGTRLFWSFGGFGF